MNFFKVTWKGAKVWTIVTSVALVILLTANLVLTQNIFLRETLNAVIGGERRVLVSGDPAEYSYFTSDYDSKEATLKAANELNEKIVEEGIVLLKNDNNTLPFASEVKKISVFGKNSVDMVLGGSGSSGASTEGAITIFDSLTDNGFEYNTKLRDFYLSSASGTGRSQNPSMGSTVWGLETGETPLDSYTSDVTASYADYNDAALIVISRIGGEGWDLPRTMYAKEPTKDGSYTAIKGAKSADDHYLQLDANEEALINDVCQRFDKVVVVINCSTSMELGFIESNDKISAAIWVGSPGKSGCNAIGKVLSGKVNPSGKLVDTYATNFKNDPTFVNFGNNNVVDGNRISVGTSKKLNYFVDYEEGIYIGYRYYETRAFTEAEATQNDEWYQNNVVYPFGYGMSYTQFDWQIVDYAPQNGELSKDGSISVTVKVENTGTVAGKEVVQLYYSAPYTAGGIEKAHVVLAGYAKTGLLAQGESEEVTITFSVQQMASYDYSDANSNAFKGYEVEAGTYKIYAAKNAHDRAESLEFVAGEDYKYTTDEKTDYEVKNRFDDVSSGLKSILSRNDWAGTWPTTPTNEDRTVTQEVFDSLRYKNEDAAKPWEVKDMPTYAKSKMSAKDTIKLYELIGENGIEWDDPRLDELVSQLTLTQMSNLIAIGNFQTQYIDNIDKPKTTDADGPAGFTLFMGDPTVYGTCFYASECVLGATWNTELAFEMGKMVGNEGIWGNVKGDGRPYSGWYAPAVNMHRSQFGGRNWEYYSEDGYLSGTMGAKVVEGANSKGVYTFVKHFALNDQEQNRNTGGLITWCDEQAMREIYLKPFEIVVKEGGTTAMMSSFNRLGTVWAGGSYELLTEVLRNEWGFRGMVITDYNYQTAYMNIDQMIRAGGDLNLSQGEYFPSKDYTPTQVAAMQRASKSIIYTVGNSVAMNGMGENVKYRYDMPIWYEWMFMADAAVVLLLAAWGFFAIKKAYKKA